MLLLRRRTLRLLSFSFVVAQPIQIAVSMHVNHKVRICLGKQEVGTGWPGRLRRDTRGCRGSTHPFLCGRELFGFLFIFFLAHREQSSLSDVAEI
jgi:hypothetical protein